jgi:hypothetical protein
MHMRRLQFLPAGMGRRLPCMAAEHQRRQGHVRTSCYLLHRPSPASTSSTDSPNARTLLSSCALYHPQSLGQRRPEIDRCDGRMRLRARA